MQKRRSILSVVFFMTICFLFQRKNRKVKDIVSTDITTEMLSTTFYEFHNDCWLNLHYFLYQKSKGSLLERIKKNGKTFLKIGEDKVYKELTNLEHQKLNKTLDF